MPNNSPRNYNQNNQFDQMDMEQPMADLRQNLLQPNELDQNVPNFS